MLQKLKDTIVKSIAVGCLISGAGSLTGRLPLPAVATIMSGAVAAGAIAATKEVADTLAQLETNHEAA